MQQHGGNITAFAKEIGCEVSEVIDFSSNINFVKPNIDFNFNTLNISPYPNYEKLEHSIADLYQVKHTELELFNGATAAIYALFKLLKPKYATLYAPLYLEYEKALTLHPCNITYLNRFQDIYAEIKENSFIVFVNPSTPDGTYYNLDNLMKIWIQKDCTIFIDESFLDFTSYKSVLPYLKTYSKLYILKSMTKFYAAAGIRIGALVSSEQNIKTIKKYEPLWKISQFDSHYLQEALKDKLFITKAKLHNKQAKKQLMELLKNFYYTKKLYNSEANFLLVELIYLNAFTLQEKLMPFKIMIRNCANFQFLNKNYVRIAVKDTKNIEFLKKALHKISMDK